MIDFAADRGGHELGDLALPERRVVRRVACHDGWGKHLQHRAPKGKPFVYEFLAEVEKGRKVETLSQKVTSTPAAIVVDFTDTAATRTAGSSGSGGGQKDRTRAACC